MSLASYCLTTAIALAAATMGILGWRYVGHYVLAVAAINAGLYLLFRSGLNLRFARPNFTTLQILLSILPGLYVMFYIDSPQGRAALLLTAVVPLLYGILDLTMRRFLAVTLTCFLAYCAMFALLAWREPDRLHAAGEWMVILALAVVMAQTGLIGGYISQLRHALDKKNRQLNGAMAQMSDRAIRDELTGVYNRRQLMQAVRSEEARATRGDNLFSVCMMDIDHFKQVNDAHGHLVGDEVLRRCADQIRNNIREIDTFGRYGGEEFLLIMPLTDRDGASIVANRLRTRIERLEFVNDRDEPFRVTISMGIAESTRASARECNEVLRRADEALYRAKHAGRNRVGVAGESGPPG